MIAFNWYEVRDGVAIPHNDSREIRARIDADGRNWYGNVEGAIINGGVLACAFKRRVEQTYDAAAFFRDGSMIPTGEKITIEITAEARS